MFDKSVYEVFVETGTRAAGTYAQSYLMYMASNAAASGVWTFDANSDVYFNGAVTWASAVDFDSTLRANAAIKHHFHSNAGEYAYQLRTESNHATADFFGMDCEVHQLIDRTAGGVRGLSMTGRLTAGETMSGTSNLIPIYGNLDIDGVINGSGLFAAGYFVVSAGGTFTALSHLASLWVDSQQGGTVTGSHELIYMTNNGATMMDAAFYLYAGHKITNLFTIDTADGMVSAATTSDYTFTKTRKIKIVAGGETGYLIMDIV